MLKNLQELKELVELAKTVQPILSKSFEELLDSYGPELQKVISRISSSVVHETHTTIQNYIKLGYTRQEALLLVLNSREALTTLLQQYKK